MHCYSGEHSAAGAAGGEQRPATEHISSCREAISSAGGLTLQCVETWRIKPGHATDSGKRAMSLVSVPFSLQPRTPSSDERAFRNNVWESLPEQFWHRNCSLTGRCDDTQCVTGDENDECKRN